jgi:hypothetical protein
MKTGVHGEPRREESGEKITTPKGIYPTYKNRAI